MRIRYQDGRARVTGAALDVRLTLCDSAQAFHFVPSGAGYAGRCAGRDARVEPAGGGFDIVAARGDLPFWRRYLDLDRDYANLFAGAPPHPMAGRAIARLPGLRVLNQPPWEALFQFILSSNNNVARIRSLVRRLSDEFGERGEMGVAGIPSPGALIAAGEGALRAAGVGYRARYLIGAAAAVADGFPLNGLASLPLAEARKALTGLPGVGDKVADCVLLFGCGHADAFPVDVWVERLMRGWFGEDCGRRAMGDRGRLRFGANAGLIQQYLFHCARLGLLEDFESGEAQ